MHARRVFEIEMASVTDNPVILPDGRVESAGNFHGEPLAYALDLLAIGATGVASISERRTFWILGPGVSRDLPPFLSTHAGLGSGYMLAQYTQAALVSECKGLAQPAGLDSIPTSGSQEDHVSMGWTSGLKLRRVLELVATVVGIELLCAAQALDLRRPLVPAAGTAAALAAIRKRVPFLDQDRDLSVDIAAATEMVRDGDVVAAVQAAAGPLL
jgi:histidine ammonia-lyase